MTWKIPAASYHGGNSQPSSQGHPMLRGEVSAACTPGCPSSWPLFGYMLGWVLWEGVFPGCSLPPTLCLSTREQLPS